ncbi:MAG: FHA domain-containing protein, partial [Deltaproteobacteria bacterium]|nr:FHA domain-containing protein [Deltaproteobacteria bacterium]
MRGHVYELPENSEQVVGRGASLDIVVDEDMVSRRHAKLMTFHNEIMVQDLGSTNGTLVNQSRVQGAHRLQVGDLVGIGTCVLELIGPSELAAAQQQGAYVAAPPTPPPMLTSGGGVNPMQTLQHFAPAAAPYAAP